MTLAKLIEAVDRGDEAAVWEEVRVLWRADLDRGIVPRLEPYDVVKAFNGSLDAAKALHDALLPGWEWLLGNKGSATVIPPDHLKSRGVIGPTRRVDNNPARALLLAILCALQEEMQK